MPNYSDAGGPFERWQGHEGGRATLITPSCSPTSSGVNTSAMGQPGRLAGPPHALSFLFFYQLCTRSNQTVVSIRNPHRNPETTLLISARERRAEGAASTDIYGRDPPTELGAIPSHTGSHPATLRTLIFFGITTFPPQNRSNLGAVGSS